MSSHTATASNGFLPNLYVIIRFSTSLPDLPISLPYKASTTSTTLTHLIRPHLPSSLFHSRLRLIYSGSILHAHQPLSSALRLSSTGKHPAQIFIHCSINSDQQLSKAQLDEEARDAYHVSELDNGRSMGSSEGDAVVETAPQGFDRLLSAGLSATEVASLRSQFLAIHAYNSTPDSMPSATELRSLEERWLDAGAQLHGGADNVGTALDSQDEGEWEDILWGNLVGFFWALGAILWLIREDGVWSKRRQWGVVTGVAANIAVCLFTGGLRA